MARKRRTTARKTAAASRRRVTAAQRKNNRLVNFFVPFFFIFCILVCLSLVGVIGYQTVTASSFFDFQAAVVRGTSRVSEPTIENIVKVNAAKSGVWYADTELIKEKIEGLRYVKTASVSRVLPNKIRVIVKERIPRAVVRIGGRDHWVDEEASILSRVSESEKRSVVTMFGWDRSQAAEALKVNKKRISLYLELKQQWREYNLASRVKAIDLSDLREPRAIVSDSGENVTIILGDKNYGRSLKEGLENIAGRGKEVESIIIGGSRHVIGYRDS